MAVSHGKSGYLQLDNSGGTPTDLSSYISKVTFSPDIAHHLTTTFGMNSQAKITGLKDAKMTVEFFNDPTLQSHLIGIYGLATTTSIIYGPQGSTGGYRKITAECWLISFPIEADVTKEERIAANFEITGDVVFTTF